MLHEMDYGYFTLFQCPKSGKAGCSRFAYLYTKRSFLTIKTTFAANSRLLRGRFSANSAAFRTDVRWLARIGFLHEKWGDSRGPFSPQTSNVRSVANLKWVRRQGDSRGGPSKWRFGATQGFFRRFSQTADRFASGLGMVKAIRISEYFRFRVWRITYAALRMCCGST